MKFNRTGMVFAFIHCVIITVLAAVSGWSLKTNPSSEGSMVFMPFGLIADQLPFFTLMVLYPFPAVGKIISHSAVTLGIFYVLGGLQWYAMGWMISSFFSKQSPVDKKR